MLHPQKFGTLPPGTSQREPALFVVQLKHVPDEPHAVCTVPDTHRLPEQQKPPVHIPLPGLLQIGVHAPPAHVGAPLAQARHAPPVTPHAMFAVPAWHVPAPQQPPLHAVWLASPHVLSQTCVTVLHAWFDPQSVTVLHPQLVPPRQRCPCPLAVQSRHVLPDAPHAVLAVPVVHVPFAPQHPPLHAVRFGAPQVPVHVCVTVLHACPVPQSAATLHPQVCVAVSQTCPAALVAQLVHAVPEGPQAAVAVPSAQRLFAPQQPTRQGVCAEHAKLHVFVAALHDTAFAGQSARVLHPQTPPDAVGSHTAPLVPWAFPVTQLAQTPPESPHAVVPVPA